ncbi:MAG: hypothetical protein M1835_007590 [Candelina submexicana]|nr:MAG: hypothetical protein M1835_007590 [Candelina submexicana]
MSNEMAIQAGRLGISKEAVIQLIHDYNSVLVPICTDSEFTNSLLKTITASAETLEQFQGHLQQHRAELSNKFHQEIVDAGQIIVAEHSTQLDEKQFQEFTEALRQPSLSHISQNLWLLVNRLKSTEQTPTDSPSASKQPPPIEDEKPPQRSRRILKARASVNQGEDNKPPRRSRHKARASVNQREDNKSLRRSRRIFETRIQKPASSL